MGTTGWLQRQLPLVLLFGETCCFFEVVGGFGPDTAIIALMEYIVASCSDKIITERIRKVVGEDFQNEFLLQFPSTEKAILERLNSIDSSKKSDVCWSISGSAPVDSPTRIIANAISGACPVSSSASDNGRPS